MAIQSLQCSQYLELNPTGVLVRLWRFYITQDYLHRLCKIH